MKMHSIVWPLEQKSTVTSLRRLASRANGLTRLVYRLLVAGAPALGILIATIWLISAPGLLPYLQAALWATGFVFMALAVEAERPHAAALLLTTGLALPMLAWLSSRLAVEFIVVAAALIAAWLVAAVLKFGD